MRSFDHRHEKYSVVCDSPNLNVRRVFFNGSVVEVEVETEGGREYLVYRPVGGMTIWDFRRKRVCKRGGGNKKVINVYVEGFSNKIKHIQINCCYMFLEYFVGGGTSKRFFKKDFSCK